MNTQMRNRRAQAMKKHQRSSVGPRCRSFCAGCITCASWRHYDLFGLFPRTFDDARIFNEQLENFYGDKECEWGAL